MTFVQSVRQNIQQAFLSFPLLLIGWSLFMGFTQGNIGLMVLTLGHLVPVPALTALVQSILDYFAQGSPLFTVANRDVCSMLPGSVNYEQAFISVAPSYWMAHVTFFFAFLLSNAVSILTQEADENADPEKVERRKNQATVAILLTSLVFAAAVLLRFFAVGCETIPGILIAFATMGSLGFGWYKLAQMCAARDADVFGIIQKILPPNAEDPPPMTCVYTGKDE